MTTAIIVMFSFLVILLITYLWWDKNPNSDQINLFGVTIMMFSAQWIGLLLIAIIAYLILN